MVALRLPAAAHRRYVRALMTVRNVRSFILAACIALAVAGGAFLGLFSCGGYYWYWQLYDFLELSTSSAWVVSTIYIYRKTPIADRRLFTTIGLCVGFFFAIHILFFTVMASVSPFYPAPPKSLGEWWQGFLFTWREGVPC